MAVFVPYVADSDNPDLLERLYGWRTGFDNPAYAAGSPCKPAVMEFPATPAGGFPKWISRERLVNCREVQV